MRICAYYALTIWLILLAPVFFPACSETGQGAALGGLLGGGAGLATGAAVGHPVWGTLIGGGLGAAGGGLIGNALSGHHHHHY